MLIINVFRAFYLRNPKPQRRQHSSMLPIARCLGRPAVANRCGIGYAVGMSDGGAYQFTLEVARIAHDNKSEDVVALDLRGISPVTDFTVICTGTSDRQMRAVADRVFEYGKKIGERPFGQSGYETATWIVIDYIDVVFHIFAKPYRDYYDLELLWGDAPRIEWARCESA